MCGQGRCLDAADLRQAFGIGEWNAGGTGAQPSGIDAQDDLSWVGIVVEFGIELLCDGEYLGIFPKRVHHPDTTRQVTGKIEFAAEIQHFGSECRHDAKIEFRFIPVLLRSRRPLYSFPVSDPVEH